jgi:hypothetical protein
VGNRMEIVTLAASAAVSEIGAFYKVYFGVFGLFLIAVLVLYWSRHELYAENLGRIRKSFYVLFLLAMAIGFMAGDVDHRDWKLLLELAAIVVFVDISVFQTPNIMKIWSAEFRQDDDYIRRTLEKNNRVTKYIESKIERFAGVVEETRSLLEQKPYPNDSEEYRNELKAYLNKYAEGFEYQVSVFQINWDGTPAQLENAVRAALLEVEAYHSFSFSTKLNEDGRLPKGEAVDRMMAAVAYVLEEEKLVVIPVYGTHNLMISIASGYVPVDMVDAAHFLNLARIFAWYMVDVNQDVV